MKWAGWLFLVACGSPTKPAAAPPPPPPPPDAAVARFDCPAMSDHFERATGLALDQKGRDELIAECEQRIAKDPDDPLTHCMAKADSIAYVFDCSKDPVGAPTRPHRGNQPEWSLILHLIGERAQQARAATGAFPAGQAALLPDHSCCLDHGRCPVTDAWKRDAVWSALGVSIDDPNLFQYSYRSDGKTFQAEAIGDLDCDGTFITYQLDGDGTRLDLTRPPPNSD